VLLQGSEGNHTFTVGPFPNAGQEASFTFDDAPSIGSLQTCTISASSTDGWKWDYLDLEYLGQTTRFNYNGWIDGDSQQRPASVTTYSPFLISPQKIQFQETTKPNQKNKQKNKQSEYEVYTFIEDPSTATFPLLLEQENGNVTLPLDNPSWEANTFTFFSDYYGDLASATISTSSTNGILFSDIRVTSPFYSYQWEYNDYIDSGYDAAGPSNKTFYGNHIFPSLK